MANPTVVLIVPFGTTSVFGKSGVLYTPDAYGRITVNTGDIESLLNGGCTYAPNDTRSYYVGAAAAASAALIVASGAMSNGALTIAAQPDVGRQLQAVVNPGTTAISAGVLTLTYTATDGTTQVDSLSLATALSTLLTLTSSKGALHVTSGAVSGLVGGTSPTLEVGTNTVLGLPVAAGFQGVSVLKENVDGADEAVGTVTAGVGLIKPTTAPNGTHTYVFVYSYIGNAT